MKQISWCCMKLSWHLTAACRAPQQLSLGRAGCFGAGAGFSWHGKKGISQRALRPAVLSASSWLRRKCRGNSRTSFHFNVHLTNLSSSQEEWQSNVHAHSPPPACFGEDRGPWLAVHKQLRAKIWTVLVQKGSCWRSWTVVSSQNNSYLMYHSLGKDFLNYISNPGVCPI